MNCEIEWRPMTNFKGRPPEWHAKRWDNGFDHTMAALRLELERNEIDSVVIETYHDRSDYTMGGRPKAGVDPKQAGVQVFFMAGKNPVCIPCARFADWVQNLKAIQMTLERNRLIRDYGCLTLEEQYAGRAQLPAGGALTTTGSLYAQVRLMLDLAKRTDLGIEDAIKSPGVFHEVYKAAANNAHPDKGKGGSDELMAGLNRARAAIIASKGW